MTEFDKLKSLSERPEQTKVTLDVDTIISAMLETMRVELAKQAGERPELARTTAQELRALIAGMVANMTAGILEAAYEANHGGDPYAAMGREAANVATCTHNAVRLTLLAMVTAKASL